MQHGLMYSGGYETNFPKLKPGAAGFTGSDGADHEYRAWPPEVDGVRIWYMEQPGKHFYAVRVMDAGADIVLPHPILLEPAKHMGHGKRFAPEPTVIPTEMLMVILADILKKNPEQRDGLNGIRNRLRS